MDYDVIRVIGLCTLGAVAWLTRETWVAYKSQKENDDEHN